MIPKDLKHDRKLIGVAILRTDITNKGLTKQNAIETLHQERSVLEQGWLLPTERASVSAHFGLP